MERLSMAAVALIWLSQQSTALTIATDLPTNWTSQGCWTDNTNGRALTGASFANPNNTQEACVDFCISYGYNIAGAEYASECYCGNSFVNPSTNASSSDCNMGCANSTAQACGGPNRLNVFWNGQRPPPGPVTNPGPPGWGNQGCYTDAGNARSLRVATDVLGGPANMSVAGCTSACQAAGYGYAGVEYAGQCFCDQSIQNNAQPASSGCSMSCNGNSSEWCGGPDRLNLYKLGAPASVSPSSTITLPFSTSSSTTTSTTTTTAATTTTTSASTTSVPVKQAVASQAPLSCPGSNGTVWTAPSGAQFLIECGIDHQGGDLKSVTVNSYEQCITACDNTPSCLDVSLSGVACYMKSTLGKAVPAQGILGAKLTQGASTPTSSSTTPSTTASSTPSAVASTTTTSTTAPVIPSQTPLSCPGSNGTIWYAPSGKTFLIECGIDHQGGDMGAVNVNSYEQCITSCDQTTGCVDVSLSGVACYQKSVLGQAVAAQGILGAKLVANPVSSSTTSTTTAAASSSTTAAPSSTTTSTSITTSAIPSQTPLSCPKSNGTLWYAPSGSRFLIECGIDHQGGDLKAVNANSYEECITSCDNTPTCVDVSLSGVACYQKSSLGPAVAAQGILGAKLVPSDFTVTSATTSTTSGTASSSTSPSAVSATTTTASTTSAATGIPTGWSYKGCWVDAVNNGQRIMQSGAPDNSNLTQASCISLCQQQGYTIAGMEYSVQCFCDNQIRQGGYLAASDSDCAMKCGGDSTEVCGGPNRLTVYSNQTNITVLQPPTVTNQTGNWTYAGCYTDGQDGDGQRAFSKQLILADNTPANCGSKCAAFGYTRFGLEFSKECYCGDEENLTAHNETVRPDAECNIACPQDGEQICGGQNRLSVYKWTGPPPYVFSYPTGAAAGSYEFFVPGVIVPLITIPGKNGKITFVEKHGTSYYGNSTGAFELDPSLADNFDLAWRELTGITTDVFCSAGLVLPDKGARQINIGGWSGTSTYGIRFFTPDGELGSNSTSEWEENASEVALQDGRWYPSAMMMSNGSILVVGGEDGSNGNPVPTLELLPTAGGTVYCQWLKDTDPNNLYPYLAVLPSGGIFVAYYNQSRILDPVTLQTTTVLPEIPGTVDRETGGRTYPLEGTSVLMPQYAPYTDPLTVMICGGSPGVASDAIDNCVSIAPDVPGANWTVERMPSQRVMTCIAALPDGTYLILNGAETGVAGFGLAQNPNMNAVLYDPTKPVGARMSVMANTTIARLYHSEAVVMDDGRVLVSGSDPQDNVHPEEMRVEVFNPPYILSGAARPTYNLSQTDWAYGGSYTLQLTSATSSSVRVSLLGAVASTHGNSMGQRTIFPAVSCSGSSCTVTAPPNSRVCPPGWFQMFVLDGPTPSRATWVRVGGDPGSLGEWPTFSDFTRPGS